MTSSLRRRWGPAAETHRACRSAAQLTSIQQERLI